ncbi:two-component hybrid sensor and regulator [Candidatus Moduliflexus flocculans]|uniref:histidine kinase n=1 Tax=Candidatus Moduliflexus flocculans TaxID=1499966 RepID=A0A081BN99_9BACT|nr:two-component hybrid sensor and regulator [Candidatus Moduliflexus flocculans]
MRLKNDELQLALERERVLLERERKLTEDLRMSLSLSLPHELRTPLNAVLGFSELLMQSPEASTIEQIRQYGKNIYDGGRRLERIVENSLFYAKLQVIMYTSGESRSRSFAESFDAGEVILDIIQQQAESFRRQGDLIADLLHANLRISSGNFTKILLELLNNAFKFSKPGTPVRVAMRLSNAHCVVQINDHGRGMTSEQIAEIGAYMQFDRRRHEQQGIGLGLIVASLLTQLEGGRLSIESIVEHGTTITLAFPCEEQREQTAKGSFTYQGKEFEFPGLVPPPTERLEQLRKSVVIGDILNVQKQIEEIKNLDSQYVAFAEKLYPLARDLNISAIEQILQHYLGEREY